VVSENGAPYTTFTFKVEAGAGSWSETAATMTINVTAVNDAPVATDNTITTDEDTTYTFSSSDFTFTDAESDSLTQVEITTLPGKGTLKLSDTPVSAGHKIAVGNIGNLTYDPVVSENGAPYTTFTFKVEAGAGSWSETAATMTINVTAVNDAPVAVDDSATVAEGGTVAVVNGTDDSVLDNDTDAEGDPLTAIKVSDPSHGSLTLNSDGTFSYTHDGSETTSDSFTYKANDGTADSNVATVTMTVNPVADGAGSSTERKPRTYFTVDFLGEITKELMSKSSGRLLDSLEAPSPDGIHLFEMEEGTKTLDEDGEIVKLIEITEAGTPPPPENTVFVGQVYDFQPSGITFSQPVSLTLGYDVNDLPEDVASVALAYYTTETGWVELEAESDVVAEVGKLTAPVEHFTLFAVLASVSPPPPPAPAPPPPPAPVPPAAFELSNLSITSSFSKVWGLLTFVVKSGEEVTITVDVTNHGGQEGSYDTLLKINGVTQTTKEITLSAGQHQKITFTVTENEPGYYVVQIGDLSGEFQSLSWFNWWLTGGLAAAIILLGWLAWYYWYYKKRQKYAP